jgi:hypothetical protein
MVTKPTHSGPSQILVRLRQRGHSSRLTETVNCTAWLPRSQFWRCRCRK